MILGRGSNFLKCSHFKPQIFTRQLLESMYYSVPKLSTCHFAAQLNVNNWAKKIFEGRFEILKQFAFFWYITPHNYVVVFWLQFQFENERSKIMLVSLAWKSDFMLPNIPRYYFLPLLLWEKALFACCSNSKYLQTSFIMIHRNQNVHQKINWHRGRHLTTFWTHWAIFEFAAIYGTKTFQTEQVRITKKIGRLISDYKTLISKFLKNKPL